MLAAHAVLTNKQTLQACNIVLCYLGTCTAVMTANDKLPRQGSQTAPRRTEKLPPSRIASGNFSPAFMAGMLMLALVNTKGAVQAQALVAPNPAASSTPTSGQACNNSDRFSYSMRLGQRLCLQHLHIRSSKDSVDAAWLLAEYAKQQGTPSDVDMISQPTNVFFHYNALRGEDLGFGIYVSCNAINIEAGNKQGFIYAVQNLQQLLDYDRSRHQIGIESGLYEAELGKLRAFVSINAGSYKFTQLCSIIEQLSLQGCSAVVLELNSAGKWAWRSELFEQVHSKNTNQLGPQQLDLLAKLCNRLHITLGVRLNIENQHAAFRKSFGCEMTTEEGSELASIMFEELAQTLKPTKTSFFYLHLAKTSDSSSAKLAKQGLSVIAPANLLVYSNITLKSAKRSAQGWLNFVPGSKLAASQGKVLEVNIENGKLQQNTNELVKQLAGLRTQSAAKLPAAICYRLAAGKNMSAAQFESIGSSLWKLRLLPQLPPAQSIESQTAPVPHAKASEEQILPQQKQAPVQDAAAQP